MTTLKSMVFIAALAAIAAGCSKDKKEETTPEFVEPSTDEAPAASLETEPAAEPVTPEASATLEEVVYFEFDSSTLDDQARAKLEQNVNWLKEDPSRALTIEGHTDSKGTTEYNVALGDKRARAAREYMIRLGADPSHIEIISFGEERPASKRALRNRRDVFVATRK